MGQWHPPLPPLPHQNLPCRPLPLPPNRKPSQSKVTARRFRKIGKILAWFIVCGAADGGSSFPYLHHDCLKGATLNWFWQQKQSCHSRQEKEGSFIHWHALCRPPLAFTQLSCFNWENNPWVHLFIFHPGLQTFKINTWHCSFCLYFTVSRMEWATTRQQSALKVLP